MAVTVDLQAGAASVIPRTRQAGCDYAMVAWSDHARSLFANGQQLLAYRPGTDTACRVDVDLPQRLAIAAK